MPITFSNVSHQFTYQKIFLILSQHFENLKALESETSFVVISPKSKVFVDIIPIDYDQEGMHAQVRVVSLVAKDFYPQKAQVFEELLMQNEKLELGALALDRDHHLIYQYRFLGPDFDPKILVKAIEIAHILIAELQKRFHIEAKHEAVEQPSSEKPKLPLKTEPLQTREEKREEKEPTPQILKALFKRIQLDDFGIYYCIRGLPIAVSEVYQALNRPSSTVEEVLKNFPELEREDLEEVRAFGARYPHLVEPEPEPEVPKTKAFQVPSVKKKKKVKVTPKEEKPVFRRIKLDDYGLYYCIRKLPITVAEIYDLMKQGKSDSFILREYSQLNIKDLEEVRAFAKLYPDKVVLEEPEEVRKPPSREVIPTPTLLSQTKKAKPKSSEPSMDRIRLDDLGIYYCIRGLPIAVSEIIDLMQEGQSDEEILKAYPKLEQEDLNQVRYFHKSRGGKL